MKLELDSNSKAHLKKLHDSQRRLIKQKEQEISKLNNLYNEKVSLTRNQGEIELAEQQERNFEKINNTLTSKEQKLNEIKEDLKSNTRTLEKQKEFITDQFQDQIENTNLNGNERLKEINYENKIKNRDMVDSANNSFDILKFNTDQLISHQKYAAKATADKSARELDYALKRQEQVQGIHKDTLKKQHQDQLQSMANEHQNEVNTTSRKHLVSSTNKERTQALELKHMEDHHQNILKQKRDTFKERYNVLETNHTEILTRIKDRFDNEIKQLVKKYSDFKNQKLSKLEDKFYNIKKVEPTIKDAGKYYQVEIQVPEHEKDLINLTAQDRKLYVSLSRKYDDKMKDGLGAEFKTRRSEVISKTLEVPDIMDSKKIVQNYHEGTLTFRIEKL